MRIFNSGDINEEHLKAFVNGYVEALQDAESSVFCMNEFDEEDENAGVVYAALVYGA